MNNYVLVTYFTINNKFIFVQRCLMGNLLSQFVIMCSQCENGMLYIKKYYIQQCSEQLLR